MNDTLEFSALQEEIMIMVLEHTTIMIELMCYIDSFDDL